MNHRSRLTRSTTRTACALALAALLLASLACETPEPNIDGPQPGPWRGWLESPGGELPFGLEFESEASGAAVLLINGPERRAVGPWRLEGNRLSLPLSPYDARLEAELSADGRRLDGTWSKTGAEGKLSSLPFHAVAGESARFAGLNGEQPSVAIDGRWAVRFERDELPAVGQFSQAQDGTVEGTFLTATGDYRFLAGRVDGRRLRLSVFDGAHAFLFDAVLDDDDRLQGQFWSRESWHETWSASRDASASLPDALGLTRWTGDASWAELSFPDLDRRPRRLDDPAFAGDARLLVLFGSWCPNCNDASEYLVELDGRYGERGLSILGLAFELTGEFERDAAQLRSYVAHHGIRYPVLLAGTSDKELASASLPLIDRVRAYPTFLFLDREDRIQAIFTGFDGPATGEAHTTLRARFERLIEELLASDATSERSGS